LQVGEAALGATSGLLIRVRELAVRSANGTLCDAERAAIGAEADALLDEVDRIAQTTRFGRKNLLDGTTDIGVVSDADATSPLEVASVDVARSDSGRWPALRRAFAGDVLEHGGKSSSACFH